MAILLLFSKEGVAFSLHSLSFCFSTVFIVSLSESPLLLPVFLLIIKPKSNTHLLFIPFIGSLCTFIVCFRKPPFHIYINTSMPNYFLISIPEQDNIISPVSKIKTITGDGPVGEFGIPKKLKVNFSISIPTYKDNWNLHAQTHPYIY